MNLIYFKPTNKIVVITTLILFVFLGIAGTTAPVKKTTFKNLKVLPQDISNEKLDNIMDHFNQSLGVRCNYCHAKNAAGKLDFESDSNHTKEDARSMMRMTLQINKDYLLVKQPMIGDSTMAVSCYTCHHGSPYPDAKSTEAPLVKLNIRPINLAICTPKK